MCIHAHRFLSLEDIQRGKGDEERTTVDAERGNP